MKKTALLFIPLVAASLASCGKTNANPLLKLQKESVISREMILNNASSSSSTYEYTSLKRVADSYLNDYTVYSSSNYGMFYILRDNNNGYSYLYFAANNTLSSNRLYYTSFSNNINYSNFGEFVLVQEYINNNTSYRFVFYDMFGKEVFSSNSSFSVYERSYSDTSIQFEIYASGQSINITYTAEGSHIVDNTYHVGDQITDDGSAIKLDDFGYAGYKASFHDFNAKVEYNGRTVSEFIMPLAQPTFTIGKYFFFYSEIELPEDAKDFDISRGGYKYDYTMTRIDYTNGASKEIEVPYYGNFRYIQLVKDASNFYTYGGIQAYELTDKKVVNQNLYRMFIVDADLNLHDDVTNLNNPIVAKDTMGNDVIVDGQNCKVYSMKLELLNDFSSIGRSFNANANVFVGMQNSKYGLFSIDGKVIVPFEYSSINAITSSNIAYGKKDGKTYLINFSVTSPSRYYAEEMANLSALSTLPTGELVFTYSDGKIVIQDANKGTTRLSLDSHNSFTNRGSFVISASNTCYSTFSAYNNSTGSYEYYIMQHVVR